MSATEQPSEEYARGWRDGYGQGRDDEADGLALRTEPPPPVRQQGVPRDRQIRHPGRDR
uniref:LytR family transcriptional regulator n=1 Tax=Streptomyces sp. NBC_00093 TaxID=2975649 RepID=A0AAU2A2J9_9ACTN